MDDALFDLTTYHQEPRRVEVIDPSWAELEAKASAIAIGDTITTRSGEAVVTRDEQAGNRRILWADYGSGVEHPHIQENLLPTEQLPPAEPAKRQRRHSKKGEASGWIEERTGNKKRSNPTTSYYYCWIAEDGQRMKVYVKARQMYRCSRMVDARCSVDEILEFLNGGKQGELF